MSEILRVETLKKSYDGFLAVNGVSFSVAKGELKALIGPNGAGKSTCFNMLMGQLKPTEGEVFFEGERITGHKPRDIWRRGVGRTFQITGTYQSMTVIENVQMALMSHHRKIFSFGSRAWKLYREEAFEFLETVSMQDQADRPCSILAYGDLKRLELAIALCHRPRLLLMDEPTAGMAPSARVELMQLVADIVRDQGVSVLFTEHDMDVVFGHAARVLVLHRGRLVAEGDPDTVRADARVREIYLGSGVVGGRAED